MAPASRDRISVDLRGLKAALLQRAKALGVSPSAYVRNTLAEALCTAEPADDCDAERQQRLATGPRMRLCLRMSRQHANATIDAARRAGLSPGYYVSGLVANVPVLLSGSRRSDYITALVASCAELSALSRDIRRLTTLLRLADAEPAKSYRTMLDTLAGDLHRHLELAATVLADLQPQARAASGAARPRR